MSNPHASLPLFDATNGFTTSEIPSRPRDLYALTPTERAVQHGIDGASDAHKHATDHAPGWLLERLGDTLLLYQGREFTSEDIRNAAGSVVNDWLTVKGRENCFPGWWRSRIRLHQLVRTGGDEIATRGSRRGSRLPRWRFPDA